ELIGKPVVEALPELAERGLLATIDRVVQSGEAEVVHAVPIERRSLSLDTIDRRVVDFVFQPLKDAAGRVSGILLQASDVTDRVHAETALRESEERYRAFVANSSEAIWRYELEEPLDLTLPPDAQLEHIYRHARLAELNDAMARMYGLTK